MLILLDHSTPRQLRQHLAGHTVHTAAQMGWDRLPDGQLLTIAQEAGYYLLITSDQKLRHQQNLTGRQIAILVLMLNNWPAIRLRIDNINEAVNRIQLGDYVEIDIAFPPRGGCVSG